MQPYEVIIPISFFAFIAVCVISSHRFKLAKLELLHRGTSNQEIESLRKELNSLKDRLNEQAIELDGVNKLLRGLNSSDSRVTESSAVREVL